MHVHVLLFLEAMNAMNITATVNVQDVLVTFNTDKKKEGKSRSLALSPNPNPVTLSPNH